MITIAQCRAARGLLDWTQQDLANASGLSKTAVNNFEKGHSDIKAASLHAIQNAFESLNIKFIGTEGVRKKTERTFILRGRPFLDNFLAKIHAQATPDELFYIGPTTRKTQTLFSESLLQDHINLLQTGKLVTQIIASENEQCPWGSPEHTRIAQNLTSQLYRTVFIYGSQVAFEIGDTDTLIAVESTKLATEEKNRFSIAWSNAIPLTDNKNTKDSALQKSV